MTVAFPTFPSGHVPSADEMAALLPLFAKKTATQAVTSSTTLVNDNELFVSVLANATYEVDTFIIYDGAAGTAIKVGFTAPSGATLDWWNNGTSGGNTSFINTGPFWGWSAIGTSNTIGTAGAGSEGVCRPGGILVTSSTPGTFQLQWAQGSSNATAVHVFAGSTMTLRRVA